MLVRMEMKAKGHYDLRVMEKEPPDCVPEIMKSEGSGLCAVLCCERSSTAEYECGRGCEWRWKGVHDDEFFDEAIGAYDYSDQCAPDTPSLPPPPPPPQQHPHPRSPQYPTIQLELDLDDTNWTTCALPLRADDMFSLAPPKAMAMQPTSNPTPPPQTPAAPPVLTRRNTYLPNPSSSMCGLLPTLSATTPPTAHTAEGPPVLTLTLLPNTLTQQAEIMPATREKVRRTAARYVRAAEGMIDIVGEEVWAAAVAVCVCFAVVGGKKTKQRVRVCAGASAGKKVGGVGWSETSSSEQHTTSRLGSSSAWTRSPRRTLPSSNPDHEPPTTPVEVSKGGEVEIRVNDNVGASATTAGLEAHVILIPIEDDDDDKLDASTESRSDRAPQLDFGPCAASSFNPPPLLWHFIVDHLESFFQVEFTAMPPSSRHVLKKNSFPGLSPLSPIRPPSFRPMDSQTAIAGERAPPAGFVGYDVGDVGAVPPTQPPSPNIPFWKTGKFIIIATINAILAIVILFSFSLKGVVTHTGILNAKIAFREPVTVDRLVNGPKDTQNKTSLGTAGAECEKQACNDRPEYEQAFGAFTGAMITQPNFTWLLTSINNFDGHVKLVDFQVLIKLNIVNGPNLSHLPSPFLIDLGTTVFNLTYQGVSLGQGTGTHTTVAPGENNVTLNGGLVPHNGSESELAVLGQLFSKYLNSDPAITWLSKGLSSLALNVPFVPATPIDGISAIDIQSLDLTFTPKNSWSPAASSNTVHARLKLPFGFDISIVEIANSFAIMQNNSIVVNISTPIGSSNVWTLWEDPVTIFDSCGDTSTWEAFTM
ncbi:hypothetical protein BU17DRAFT_72435 [Hysterangium stoloniferum]|nr:hypothetical protein BU17DRAFT_72435 [Hysterangium stoloniferum]